MKKSNQRKILLFVFLCMITASICIILRVFNDNIVFFLTTSELYQSHHDKTLRVGGLVKIGTISYTDNTGGVQFVLTDNLKDLKVTYRGVLPSLFKEGSGAVVSGKMDYTKDIFHGEEVLAKHDENYRPATKGVFR